jgi:hypothetical protein
MDKTRYGPAFAANEQKMKIPDEKKTAKSPGIEIVAAQPQV